jgi:hypothetical protein
MRKSLMIVAAIGIGISGNAITSQAAPMDGFALDKIAGAKQDGLVNVHFWRRWWYPRVPVYGGYYPNVGAYTYNYAYPRPYYHVYYPRAPFYGAGVPNYYPPAAYYPSPQIIYVVPQTYYAPPAYYPPQAAPYGYPTRDVEYDGEW